MARDLIVRDSLQAHYTKPFPDGSYSHRLVHPRLDGTCILVTEFHPQVGTVFEDVQNSTDEVVVVTRGKVRVWTGSKDKARVIYQRGFYLAEAGVRYSIEALEPDTVLVCSFSKALVGPIPDDPFPKEMASASEA